MAQSLFTSQTPVNGDSHDGTPTIVTATTMQFAVAGQITHVRFWQNTTRTGNETLLVWQVTAADTAPAGTLLGQVTIAASSTTAGTWNSIALSSPVSVATNTLYRIGRYNDTGAYVSSPSVFSSPITNLNITAPNNGSNPVGLGTLRQGTFRIGGGSPTAYPSTEFNNSNYFVDVVYDIASPTVTGSALADLGALTGTLNGLVTVPGTALIDLGALTGTASGLVTIPGTGLADLGALTGTASGLVSVGGTAVADLGALSAAITGSVTPSIFGTGFMDLGALTADAVGTVEAPVMGTAAMDLGALTATAVGSKEISGSAVADLGRLYATAVEPAPDPGPTPIQRLTDIAEALRACLCEAAAQRPHPPQHCCFRVGEEVAHDADMFTDLCCEGLAYVSVGDIYPVVDSFPEQSIVTQANQVCAFPSWAINLKMGIVRCAPVGTDTTMPSCTEWNVAAMQNMYDAQSLASAACCFKALWIESEPGLSVVFGPNSTTTPEGGCMERYLVMQVQTTSCC